MALATAIDMVRQMLMDVDEVSPEMSDNAIAAHLRHAVERYSAHVPHYRLVTRPTQVGEMVVDISTLTDRVVVEAVEYPLGEVPRSFVRFRVWGDELTLLSGPVPSGDNCRIYYGGLHTLDEAATTIPEGDMHLLATGGAGYAALALSRMATNRVTTGGKGVAEAYRLWGNEALQRFHGALSQRSSRRRVGRVYLYPEGG